MVSQPHSPHFTGAQTPSQPTALLPSDLWAFIGARGVEGFSLLETPVISTYGTSIMLQIHLWKTDNTFFFFLLNVISLKQTVKLMFYNKFDKVAPLKSNRF